MLREWETERERRGEQVVWDSSVALSLSLGWLTAVDLQSFAVGVTFISVRAVLIFYARF